MDDTPDAQGTDRGHSFDRERLRTVAEKIQVGDTDEGAEALAEMIELARDQGRGNIRQAMRDELMDMRLRAENDAALAKFASKYPALKDNDVLVDAAKRVLKNEIVDDLKKAGATDDMLAPLHEDVGGLVAAHGQARARGLALRKPDELLDATGAYLSREFKLRPARRSPQEYIRNMREDRGFAADGSGQMGAKAASAPVDSRTARYIQDLRAARGFPAR